MINQESRFARGYHERTKHSDWSLRTQGHYLDWAIQPLPFKIYQNLEPVPLPTITTRSDRAVLSVLPQIDADVSGRGLDTEDLNRLLYFSAGITKRRSSPRGEILFRAAACTGALYEIELYVVTGDLDGLPAGVYQYSPRDGGLYCLRRGDYRQVLVSASAEAPSVVQAQLIILSTGTYWRNSWKYQARTYRHFGWDNGAILANLLTMCHALGYPARLILGFVDSGVSRLLDLDTDREVALSMVCVGRTPERGSCSVGPIGPLQLETVPLSTSEVDYPEMRQMHSATLLDSAKEVLQWRKVMPAPSTGDIQHQGVQLETEDVGLLSLDSPESVILRRGSSRRFVREPISFQQFSALLHCSSQGVPADFLDPPGALLNEWYLIVNSVDGLTSGSYVFHRESGRIEVLNEGDFRSEAGSLALGQALAAEASFDVFFLADLEAILNRYGNRGYRAVQLEAGILGGKLYLAAYAQRLGATGLTFFDDDVVEFFCPHARGKSAIFLMALGKGRRPTPVQ